jgi:4-coumarate--CoA ligase
MTLYLIVLLEYVPDTIQVMISHHNVIAQCLQIQQETPADYKKILAVLPLFHSTSHTNILISILTTPVTGLVHQMHMPILLNAEVYMLPTFTMESMLSAVVTYQISELLLVPPILIRFVHDPLVSSYDLSHIKRFSSGAALISSEVLQKLEARFPGTGFQQGYGMTESCSCITKHPADKKEYKYAQRGGTIVANTEVKIVHVETGAELGFGEEGEVLARGPQVVMGYLDNAAATRETFDDGGWLHTGDVGYVDREGFITITDRIKEMVKVKGIAVSPAEIEGLLLGHPAVEDAAVTSVADAYSGERPKAYVVLKHGARNGDLEALGRQLIMYVKERKVRYKWITAVEFVDEVPKSAAGKILRRVLRDMEKGNSGGRFVVEERVQAKL